MPPTTLTRSRSLRDRAIAQLNRITDLHIDFLRDQIIELQKTATELRAELAATEVEDVPANGFLWVGDIVRTPNGYLAVVTDDSFPSATGAGKFVSIAPVNKKTPLEKFAWWNSAELVLMNRGPLAAYRQSQRGQAAAN